MLATFYKQIANIDYFARISDSLSIVLDLTFLEGL